MKNLPDEIVVMDNDSADKEFKILVVITLKQYGDEVSSLMRKMEFERFELSGLSGKPEEIIRKSESEIKIIENEKESILNDLADISAEWQSELIGFKGTAGN